MLRVTARAPIRPTEDASRVAKAVAALFPDATLTQSDIDVSAAGGSLDRLRELVRAQRIPDTARSAMLGGLSEDGLRAHFLLGKQAAAVGRAHFGPLRSPLGDIDVTIEGDAPGEVERAIYKCAPDTTVPIELSEVPISDRPAPL
jgi:predicted RNA binding protein with dsRBD fold (UPF0201 family)